MNVLCVRYLGEEREGEREMGEREKKKIKA
jgi:hypothetical protein